MENDTRRENKADPSDRILSTEDTEHAFLQAALDQNVEWWLALSEYQRWYFTVKAGYYTMGIKNDTLRGLAIGGGVVLLGIFAWWMEIHPVVSLVLIIAGVILGIVLMWESERPRKK